jgi:intracellular septation protein A
MRYSEHGSSTITPQYFIPRDRSGAIWRVIIGFVLALAIMLLLNLVPSTVGGEPEASLLSLVAISILCFYIVYLKQQNLDLVMQVEFQNLLFSQALALDSAFCIFVKRDGEVVYTNQGLREVMPNIKDKSLAELSTLLDALKLSDHSKTVISNAVFALDFASIPVTIGSAHNQKSFTLEVAPLARPSGYVVLKGHAPSGHANIEG